MLLPGEPCVERSISTLLFIMTVSGRRHASDWRTCPPAPKRVAVRLSQLHTASPNNVEVILDHDPPAGRSRHDLDAKSRLRPALAPQPAWICWTADAVQPCRASRSSPGLDPDSARAEAAVRQETRIQPHFQNPNVDFWTRLQ